MRNMHFQTRHTITKMSAMGCSLATAMLLAPATQAGLADLRLFPDPVGNFPCEPGSFATASQSYGVSPNGSVLAGGVEVALIEWFEQTCAENFIGWEVRPCNNAVSCILTCPAGCEPPQPCFSLDRCPSHTFPSWAMTWDAGDDVTGLPPFFDGEIQERLLESVGHDASGSGIVVGTTP